MEIKSKFSKGIIIAALIAGMCVCATVHILELLKISISWPAFMPFIMFTIAGWKMDQMKSIFVGGIVGILMSGLVIKSIYIIIGKTGIFTTYLIPIFIAVFILVALGDALPIFFNNYTFCVYTIAIANPVQDTIEWTIVMLLGGAFYASAMLLLFHLFLKQDPEEKNESTTGLDVI